MNNTAHDWLSIEKRYVTGHESQRDLAATLNIPAATLMKQAAARKWGAKRVAYRRIAEGGSAQDGTDSGGAGSGEGERYSPRAAEELARRSRLLERLVELREAILQDLFSRAS